MSSLRVDEQEEDLGGGRTIAGIIIAVVSRWRAEIAVLVEL